MGKWLAGSALAMTIAGGAAIAPTPASAQDYLGSHLEAQRYGNLRAIQQKNRATQQRRRGVPRSPGAMHRPRPAPATEDEERRARARAAAADAWRLIQPEYEMRVRRDGRAAAQRWASAKAVEMGRARAAAERRRR